MSAAAFSRTAFMSGAARASHLIWDEAPHVVSDPFTALLMPAQYAEWIAGLRDYVGGDLVAPLRASVLWRARTVEDALERAMARGVRQYAVLGAGMDSFAWRRTELLPALRVFEIDHPDTQSWKRQGLADMRVAEPEGLHFVPADLGRMALRDALAQSEWDFAQPGFFCWTGVTMYLHPEAVAASLAAIAALGEGTGIAFTYLRHEALLSGMDLKALQTIRNASESVGEPYHAYYAPAEIEDVARAAGFTLISHHEPAASPHFAGRRDGLMPHAAELLVEATV